MTRDSPARPLNAPNVAVCIAAYNEERSIGIVVSEIRALGYGQVIVVDDGSDDSTFSAAMAAGALAIRNKSNSGQWTALKTAFRVALRSGADVIVTFDGDGQHEPSAIGTLVEPILRQEADVVLGSRNKRARYVGRTHRRIGTDFLNRAMQLLTGYEFSDCLSGLNAIRSDLLQKVLPVLTERQYGRLEFLLRVCSQKPRLLEVPAVFHASQKSTKGQVRFAANLVRTVIKTKLVSSKLPPACP